MYYHRYISSYALFFVYVAFNYHFQDHEKQIEELQNQIKNLKDENENIKTKVLYQIYR